MDDILIPLTTKITLTPDNIKKVIPKLQKLNQLLEQYNHVKQTQGELTKLQEQEDRNKELKSMLKEWKYNRDNPDPDVDLGNGKILRTVWKAAPDD